MRRRHRTRSLSAARATFRCSRPPETLVSFSAGNFFGQLAQLAADRFRDESNIALPGRDCRAEHTGKIHDLGEPEKNAVALVGLPTVADRV